MKPTRLQLCAHLRKVAEDTANPERAEAMRWAADEIQELTENERRLEDQVKELSIRAGQVV